MKSLAAFFLAFALLGAAPAPVSDSVRAMNGAAEKYVRLSLALGRHDPVELLGRGDIGGLSGTSRLGARERDQGAQRIFGLA